MVNLFKDLTLSARPRQWLKNLSLYAALIFSGNLLDKQKFITVTIAFIIFCFLASATYIFNDVMDINRDRLHPFKRFRPIAKGSLPIPTALFAAITLSFLGLAWAANLTFFFFLVCFAYLILQLLYTFYLKNVVILDVLIIATGFIMRVYAGALVLGIHLSVWFLLCVVSVSLFLAVGKRRSELGILLESAPNHRKTLALYPPSLLDDYLSIFASSTWISWALFTFFEPPPPSHPLLPIFAFLPLTFSGIGKWLMVTIPIVIYGIMRYLMIIYEGGKAESPEKVLLSDKPLLASVIIWGLMIIGIIYGAEF